MDPDACLKEINEQLFHIGGEYARSLELIESLATWIAKGGFELGEYLNGGDWEYVLIGAYWFCIDYHGGMWSDEYRLQCLISRVYQPGPREDGTEPESCEHDVYGALVALFDAWVGQSA